MPLSYQTKSGLLPTNTYTATAVLTQTLIPTETPEPSLTPTTAITLTPTFALPQGEVISAQGTAAMVRVQPTCMRPTCMPAITLPF